MIDARATLDPAQGVVVAAHVQAPEPGEPLWTVSADLGGPRADGFSLHLVGACGASPADALVRGAGEAVERRALRADGPVTAPALAPVSCAPAPPVDLEAWWPAGIAPVETVPATDVATGAPVPVPRALVDDRPAREPGVDVGPSGAAAGAGLEHAVRSALYEVVERDAVLCAWAAELAPRGVDADAVVATGAGGRRAQALKRAAADLGLRRRLAVLPTCLPGRPAFVAALEGPDGVEGFGVKLADDPGSAGVGALQEAFQMRALLRLRRRTGAPAVPGPVDGDLARAAFLAGPEGADVLRAWVASWGPGAPEPLPVPAALPLSEAFGHVLRDGGRPLVADLSGRLPARAHAMGWRVARVLVPGLQPLRIDERLDHTWLRARVAGTAARTGLTHDPALRGRGGTPHPLV